MMYGSDARTEFFRVLHQALRHTQIWLLMRQNLAVRGIDFHLYYPQPRSSAATDGYAQNRLTLRHHFYFGEPFDTYSEAEAIAE